MARNWQVALTVPGVSRDAFGARLRLIIDQYNSVETFSKRVGISPSALRKWLKGQAEPSRDRLVAVALAGRVSVDWLAAGVGPMMRADAATGAASGGVEESVPSESYGANEYFLPRGQQGAAGGAPGASLINIHISDCIAVKLDWAREHLGVGPENLALIRSQDSMPGLGIHNGDLLLVATGETKIRSGTVYVIALEEELIVRRIHKKADGSLVLADDTPSWRDEVDRHTAAKLKIFGRVVWVGKII